MHNGKGQKDCKPYTASLSHSPHLEESSCGSHFEMRELPQEKYSYVCVYIKVSHNKCEMADGKQIYLFIYVFVYLCIYLCVCLFMYLSKKPYPGPNILEFEVDSNTSSALRYTGLFEMIVGVLTTCHLVLQMQPLVISFYGVTSRIRFMFLLFPQVSRN